MSKRLRLLPDVVLLEQQIATIRQHLGGSYTALLTAMVLDPALQLSLNGPANHRRNPNENLARELLELFSLGEGHYSEADVREACSAAGLALQAALAEPPSGRGAVAPLAWVSRWPCSSASTCSTLAITPGSLMLSSLLSTNPFEPSRHPASVPTTR